MIILTQNKSLEVVLSGSVTTNQLQWSTSYLLTKLTCCNNISSCETRLSLDGNTNNSTRITIVPIPTSSDNTFTYTNNVEFISVINIDTAPATLTLQVNDNGTRYKILTLTMSVGDQLIYNEDSGFQIFDSTGGLKMTLGATTITSLISAGSYIVITGSGTLASPYVISADATTTATASKLVARDANGNAYANNFINTVTSTASTGGTTTLNPNSSRFQILTGTLAQTYKLPSANTFSQGGTTFEFNNNSTGLLTIVDATNGAVTTILSGGYKKVICIDNSTSAGVWDLAGLLPSNVQWGTDGATSGKTIELDFPVTNNRVLTFPDLTDTMVSRTSTDTLTNKTWNGVKIGLAYGGTNADLSATGGTSQVLKQTSVGANITVAQLASSDLSDVSSLVTLTGTQTLTNKRITQRTGTTASSATPTINTDNVDYYSITALSTAITSFTTNLSGTPTTAQTLWISITDNGTARAITWGTSFEASTIPLPTTTVVSTRLDVAFIWNEATSKWRCVGAS